VLLGFRNPMNRRTCWRGWRRNSCGGWRCCHSNMMLALLRYKHAVHRVQENLSALLVFNDVLYDIRLCVDWTLSATLHKCHMKHMPRRS